LPVCPGHGELATAALMRMIQTKGIPAGQRKGSGCVKSQTYQGAFVSDIAVFVLKRDV